MFLRLEQSSISDKILGFCFLGMLETQFSKMDKKQKPKYCESSFKLYYQERVNMGNLILFLLHIQMLRNVVAKHLNVILDSLSGINAVNPFKQTLFKLENNFLFHLNF